MLKLSIILKAATAVVMMAVLLLSTSANFRAGGCKKEKQAVTSLQTSDEEQDTDASVSNPAKKNSNTLLSLSEYLHDHQLIFYPVAMRSFGNGTDKADLPIHHPELLTPPPKQVC